MSAAILSMFNTTHEQASFQERVVNALNNNPMTMNEMTVFFGRSRAYMSPVVRDLRRDGKITLVGGRPDWIYITPRHHNVIGSAGQWAIYQSLLRSPKPVSGVAADCDLDRASVHVMINKLIKREFVVINKAETELNKMRVFESVSGARFIQDD